MDGYLKAIGGKKRVRAIKDATYKWTVWANNRQAGTATTQVLAPSFARADLTLEDGRQLFVVNDRSAWMLGRDGKVQTLPDAELNTARLQAVLDANHLLDFKKRNVLARVIAYENTGSSPAYVVEFYLRTGVRRKYWFHTVTKLLMRIDDEDSRTITRMEDYRKEQLILEPHRVVVNNGGVGDLIFILKSVIYNMGLPQWIFEPPRPVGL